MKGSSFERDICRLLSLWVSKGESTDIFWRSAMSGGRASVGLKRGEVLRQSGDISAVAAEGHFLTDKAYIETKHLKDISIMGLITGKGPLVGIWKYTVEQASNYSKVPVLIVKENRYPTILVTTLPGTALFKFTPRIVTNDGMHIGLLDNILAVKRRRVKL